VIELELFGTKLAPQAPREREIRRLCTLTAASRGVAAGHVAIEFVDASRIADLNERYRGKAGPTDVLSFPIDGVEPLHAGAKAAVEGDVAAAPAPQSVPRELGDIIICPPLAVDLRAAIVHGMLHLLGMDHERDDGQMLALERELLTGALR